jgi:cytochrome c biogenesis protein CcmG/thiol:disulfide interchange protein DsbE
MQSLKHKILGPLVLLVAASALYVFAMPSYRQGEASMAGRTPQDFPFQVDGRSMHLADYKGKVVVLNFWASWCPPCVEETPSLVQLQQAIAPQGGVVLGVSVDEDMDAYNKFVQEKQLNFPTFVDVSKKLAPEYGTSMYPETYLIDRNGKLARKIVGPQDWQSPEIMSSIEVLLNQK